MNNLWLKFKKSIGRFSPAGINVNINSLRTKLVLLFILLIIVPVIVIEQISVRTISDNLVKKAKESLANATSQNLNYYEQTLKQIANGYSLQLVFNEDILKFAKTRDGGDSLQQFVIGNSAQKELQNIIANYTDIFSSAVIVKENGECLGYPTKITSSKQLTDTAWYRKIAGNPDGTWLEKHSEGLPDTYNNNYVLSYGLPLNDTINSRVYGVLVLDIKPDTFKTILSSINVGKEAHSYAVLNSKEVISDNSQSFTKEDTSLDKNLLLKQAEEYSNKKDSMVFTQKYKGENHIVSYVKSKTTGWVFVTTMPESEVTALTKQIQFNILVIALVSVIVAVFIGILFSFGMTKDIKKLIAVMDQVKKGDFGAGIFFRRKDEIGKLADSFNSMLQHLRSFVLQSKSLSENLDGSSKNIAGITLEANNISSGIGKAIQEVAEGASKQASEAEKSLEAMKGLSEEIAKVIQSMELMAEISRNVSNTTANGIITADTLNTKTIETKQSTLQAVSKINQLNGYVSGINKITNTLQVIAAQTRLLSLNATIEAARAGEAGKGFGVVATEIGNLAKQSNESTKEIELYVGRILSETRDATQAVENTDKVIREQSEIIQETEQEFNNINSSVKSLIANINNILSESAAMSDFKDVVLTSIQNTSAVSDETAAVSEEVYASVEQYLAFIGDLDSTAMKLKDLSQNLASEMDSFTL